MLIKIKNIAIFDMDGTLVETDAANNAAYRVALARFGLNGLSGLRGRWAATSIRSAAGLNAEEMGAVSRAKMAAYWQKLRWTRLGPAAVDLKRALDNRASFGKIVLLTDSSERRVWETLRYWDLARHFDAVFCNGGRGDKYANYFESCDSDPAACVVWENEEDKMSSAIAAGVKMENIRKVG